MEKYSIYHTRITFSCISICCSVINSSFYISTQEEVKANYTLKYGRDWKDVVAVIVILPISIIWGICLLLLLPLVFF